MANKRKNTAKMRGGDLGGFTIIEVVLVLAIAGLIFLMVFIALPALQRSQRDTQRRNDMGALASQITQYQSNNNGRLPKSGEGAFVKAFDETKDDMTMDANWQCSKTNPNSATCLIRNYMNASGAKENTYRDPDGYTYGLSIVDFKKDGFQMPTGAFGDTGNDKEAYVIHMVQHAKCGDNEDVVESEGARDYAIVYKLEGSGTYCNDNS